MKYLTKYKIFESQEEDSKIENIEEICDVCVDIMQELEDSGFRIGTSVSRQDDNLKLRLTCNISNSIAFRWGKHHVVDVYDRLNTYLSTVGFVEVDRSLGSVAKFPVVDGMYQASIIFDEK